MNLHEKLIEVRKSVDYLKKEAKSTQYNYVSSSQVIGSLRAKLNEHNILLVPEITATNVQFQEVENVDKYGQLKKTRTYLTEIEMLMTWVDAKNPDDKIVCQWYAQGVDIAGEKGVGKALTYAEKYFMLKFFNIPTDKDDPDAFQKKHETPVKAISKLKGNLDEFFKRIQGSKSLEALKLNFVSYSDFTWTQDEIKEITEEKNRIKETLK